MNGELRVPASEDIEPALDIAQIHAAERNHPGPDLEVVFLLQDFEKIKILKQYLLTEGTDESEVKLSLLKEQLSRFDIEGLKGIPAYEIVAEGKTLLHHLSR